METHNIMIPIQKKNPPLELLTLLPWTESLANTKPS